MTHSESTVLREVEIAGAYVESSDGPNGRSGWWRGLRERLLPLQRPAKNESLWRDYAWVVGEQLQERLREDDETVDQLHAFLHAQLLDLDEKKSFISVSMRIWIGVDGYVRRAVFEPLGSRRADAQLRRIVMGRPLPASPPDMPSPIELMITLTPKCQGARHHPAPSLGS
ncbi:MULTISPECIES: hypothetical protein [Pseudomonadaceae]|uniref:hypothetical protein n=1 Tax=Pseudomonadaceae TaxID=135621 RepID=UPI00289EFF28|nr:MULTISPECIES: hypothetical protein [Pseudomonadaceae]